MKIFNISFKRVQIYNYSLCCKNIFAPFLLTLTHLNWAQWGHFNF
jgi:hypothetical protein